MFILLLLSKEQGNRLGIISIPERWFCFVFIVLRLCHPKHGHTYFANLLRKQKPTYCISKEQVQLCCEFLKTRWEPSCPWIQAFTSDCLEAADTYEKRVPSWNLLGLKVMSQCSWLSSSPGSDVTIVAVKKTISNPDICATRCISQLSLANATPEALNMEIKPKCFNKDRKSVV